jgi:hypothetical protein
MTRTEQQIEDRLCDILAATGQTFRRQHRLAGGIVDVVTDTVLYECKATFSFENVCAAIGQATVYAAEMGWFETNHLCDCGSFDCACKRKQYSICIVSGGTPSRRVVRACKFAKISLLSV